MDITFKYIWRWFWIFWWQLFNLSRGIHVVDHFFCVIKNKLMPAENGLWSMLNTHIITGCLGIGYVVIRNKFIAWNQLSLWVSSGMIFWTFCHLYDEFQNPALWDTTGFFYIHKKILVTYVQVVLDLRTSSVPTMRRKSIFSVSWN